MKRGSKAKHQICMADLPLPVYLQHRHRVLTCQVAAIKGAIRAAERELENTRAAMAALPKEKNA
jgi:hypothetical protein